MDTLPQVRVLPAEFSPLADLRRFVRSRAAEAGLPAPAVDDLVVAVTEACTEVLAHERGSELLVSWWAHDDVVEIRLKSDGSGKDTDAVIDITDAEGLDELGEFDEGRLAFPYILAFVDEIDVRPGVPGRSGSTIRLVKKAGAAVTRGRRACRSGGCS
jgi:anti-sigma regulatory factor (Ser/Thr protein kinase)